MSASREGTASAWRKTCVRIICRKACSFSLTLPRGNISLKGTCTWQHLSLPWEPQEPLVFSSCPLLSEHQEDWKDILFSEPRMEHVVHLCPLCCGIPEACLLNCGFDSLCEWTWGLGENIWAVKDFWRLSKWKLKLAKINSETRCITTECFWLNLCIVQLLFSLFSECRDEHSALCML